MLQKISFEDWQSIKKKFYDTRPDMCCCKVSLVNQSRVEVTWQDMIGCKLHCGHQGVKSGGICTCGEIAP